MEMCDTVVWTWKGWDLQENLECRRQLKFPLPAPVACLDLEGLQGRRSCGDGFPQSERQGEP